MEEMNHVHNWGEFGQEDCGYLYCVCECGVAKGYGSDVVGIAPTLGQLLKRDWNVIEVREITDDEEREQLLFLGEEL